MVMFTKDSSVQNKEDVGKDWIPCYYFHCLLLHKHINNIYQVC